MGEALQVSPELNVNRLVDPHRLSHLRDRRLIAKHADAADGGVTGNGLSEEEDHHQRPEDGRNRPG